MSDHRAALIAARLAAALDAEDCSAAAALLADECVYQLGTEVLTGPDDIISSYAANGVTAHRRFDAIEFVSEVTPTGTDSFVIAYTDRVLLRGVWHEYRCRQHVRVNGAGLVYEIRHEELAGEQERLSAFERQHTPETS